MLKMRSFGTIFAAIMVARTFAFVPSHRTQPIVSPVALLSSNNNNNMPLVERPDPSILVSAADADTQKGAIALPSSGLVGGTTVFASLLTGLENALPNGWFALWSDYAWGVPLGSIFVAAGISHFALKEAIHCSCGTFPLRERKNWV
mmetsp:Transcript_25153/g.37171  ORF Transcript_25153/g.37171 Transcript_25153/m.37171 type:complete len:147 (-) Transcript_25153:305-745(-)